MTVAEKSVKIIEVMRQVLASSKRPSKEDEQKVLDWVNGGEHGSDYFKSLESWLDSGPNQVAVKTVAMFLQDGDTSRFTNLDVAVDGGRLVCEDEEEQEDSGWTPIVIKDSDIDAGRLFGDKAAYIQELVNNHAHREWRCVYELHKKEEAAWDREKQRMMAAAKKMAKRPADGGEEAEEFEPIVPPVDKHFIVSPKVKKMGKALCSSTSERCKKVRAEGPPSSGKSDWCVWLAATEKRPFFSINCATVREPQQWFGEPQAKKGSTYWRVSEFVKAIELGGCVVRLEELNRLSSYIQNPLLELLEDGRTHVEGYGMVEIGPDTIFIATMNIGLQYQGTYKMCESLLSRFAIKVEFKPLTESQTVKTLIARTGISEDIAKKLAAIKAQVDAKTGVVGTGSYDKPITYRQLEAACHLYPSLGNEAIRVTILNHYDNDGHDSERSQCLKLVAGVGLA